MLFFNFFSSFLGKLPFITKIFYKRKEPLKENALYNFIYLFSLVITESNTLGVC